MNRNPPIPRRSFLKTTAAAAVSVNLSLPKRRTDKPNLLFLWTDEQRPDTFAAYGNAKLQAPHLNKLAQESCVFEQAYCTQPVCTPSRSSIMTGYWPHQTGCRSNNIPLRPDSACLPEILADPDYRTGYLGKWHLGDEVFPQHGFEEWEAIEDGYEKYYSQGRDKGATSSYTKFLLELGYKPENERGIFGRSFCARLPFDHCKPEFLRRKAQDFLARHQNEPFILSVNYLEPHMPFFGPLDDLHDPAEVDLPGNFEDPLEENEPLRYRLIREHLRENGFGDQPLETEADWRRLICNYWGLVAQVDRSVGAILGTLEDLGLLDNTVIVYTSDHGDMMGSHRLLAKTLSYEESIGIPLLLRAPGRIRPGSRYPSRVSQIDLMPTLLDLLGHADKADPLPGRSLIPALDQGVAATDPVFVEWNVARGDNPTGDGTLREVPGHSQEEVESAFRSTWRMALSQDGWKLCLSQGDQSQLFDLNNDPLETANLFGRPEHAAIVSELTAEIEAWRIRVGDAP